MFAQNTQYDSFIYTRFDENRLLHFSMCQKYADDFVVFFYIGWYQTRNTYLRVISLAWRRSYQPTTSEASPKYIYKTNT